MVNSKEIEYFLNLYKFKIKTIIDFFESKYGSRNPVKLWRSGLIPRIGSLDFDSQAFYSFHGSGCTVEFGNGQIVSFDFSDDELFNFDNFKFKLFLESILKTTITDEELNAFLSNNLNR